VNLPQNSQWRKTAVIHSNY